MAAAFRQYILYLPSILPLTEPNAPPANVRGQNASPTNILVQWGDVPAADQNGIILSYTVTYKALPDGNPQTKVVDAPTTQAYLTGLNEYTQYRIFVVASTIKGSGPDSDKVDTFTDEDSMYPKRLLFILITFFFHERLMRKCKNRIFKDNLI